MAMEMRDWLGPEIERDLKEAIEWKQLSRFSDKDFSCIFSDNGSNLSIYRKHPRSVAKVVQILDIVASPAQFKCRLSDGHVAIKAVFTRQACEALEAQGQRDVADLLPGMQISIPEFEITATTMGKSDERVQLKLRHVAVFNSMRQGTLGNPEDIHKRSGVEKALATLKDLSRKRLQEVQHSSRPGSSGSAGASSSSVHDLTHLTPFASGDSQAFATQWAAGGAGKQQSSAINLANPIAPARSTQVSTPGRNGFKNPLLKDPMESIKMLPATRPTSGFVHYVDRTSPDVEGQAVNPTTGKAGPADQTRQPCFIDLTDAADTHEDDTGLNIETEDAKVDLAGQADHSGNDVDHDPVSALVDGDEWKADKTKSHDIDPGLLGASPSSNANCGAPWYGLTQIKRSHCVVPLEQQKLLDRKESWNPPIPGREFPLLNIPRAILQQIEDRKSAEALQQEAHDESIPSRPISRESKTSYSSRTPLSSPERELSWPLSSPIGSRRDELPPDSSLLGTRGERWSTRPEEREQIVVDESLPPDSSPDLDVETKSAESKLSPVEMGSRGQFDTSPSQQNSRKFLSEANADRTADPFLEESVLVPQSTLTKSEPAGSHKIESAAGSSPPHSRAQQQASSAQTRIVASPYTPDIQFAQRTSNPQFFDGNQSEESPNPLSSSPNADRMAEEQLQRDLVASAQKKSVTQSSSAISRAKSSPLGKQSILSDDDVMDLDPKTPPRQVLGKHVLASPAATSGRPHKSKFGFSQEEPVIKDPALTAAEEKMKFMAARKQANRNRAMQAKARADVKDQPDGQISSNTPTSSHAISEKAVVIDGDDDFHQLDRTDSNPGRISDEHGAQEHNVRSENNAEEPMVTVSFESLYQEFTTAYEDYNGNLKHFTNLLKDIKRSGNHLHQFLWDDYVIRNKTDYLPYSIECLESGDRPVSYENFYAKRIVKPIYIQGVLTRDKLDGLFAAEDIRYQSGSQASPRSRGRPPYARRVLDRYVPSPRSQAAASPAGASTGIAQTLKQKKSLKLMSFGSSPSKDTSRRASRNAFAQLNKTPTVDASPSALTEATAPLSSSRSGLPKRSLPWAASSASTSASHRAVRVSDVPASTASESGRGSTKRGRRF
ncbi:hypothetical protein, variant [Verruconis gallopava]|uniref:Shelterin complex subunit TPP1/Est3 domain-containing protein n=1 Tax=Verruconis gallopava TaxID=253628 RepID=A0A0D1YL79_9PEZI|nr:hypothetical protein, variant [Verruconis gallopava]KIW01557.1 hypothetical protein, variant [Verruconis gallopava]